MLGSRPDDDAGTIYITDAGIRTVSGSHAKILNQAIMNPSNVVIEKGIAELNSGIDQFLVSPCLPRLSRGKRRIWCERRVGGIGKWMRREKMRAVIVDDVDQNLAILIDADKSAGRSREGEGPQIQSPGLQRPRKNVNAGLPPIPD